MGLKIYNSLSNKLSFGSLGFSFIILSSVFSTISFINSNYKNNALSIDMVCAKAGISATLFRKLFKKYYQKTPTEYITSLRLEYARKLISGGMAIENAAYELDGEKMLRILNELSTHSYAEKDSCDSAGCRHVAEHRHFGWLQKRRQR